MTVVRLVKSIKDRKWDPDHDGPKEAWRRLNEAWRDLVSSLAQQANAYQIVTQEFTGPVATLTFKVPNQSRPLGVSLVSLYRPDTGATDAAAAAFTWTYEGGEVSTTAFSALAATRWRATFQIVGGS